MADIGQTDHDSIGRIVAAYATRPDVSQTDIVTLFARLRGTVTGAARGAAAPLADMGLPAAQAAVEPALPPEKAVTRDRVYCLCCGKGFKMLRRHLSAEHGLTEAEYRARFGLPEDMPLVAPSYSDSKAAYAKKAGFGKYRRSPGARAAKSETAG
ncbi:MucR family transcriptional regulator [Mesobaculum littorinae]|uniref:MucR family transcriptional regulator n=1 Tax=Mesobaculum littorinae TaxID=2486419 RepID=A0A438ADS2_9RHOB|nr:MucR family transcriptional regulator [Mesobaculum littorinae]RVV96853.1 MucR family transcriptional regulator [Mesobaculum littorinae]